MLRLQGHVAIITDAVRGIGQVLGVGLARQGARVVAADILDATATAEKVQATGVRPLLCTSM